MNVLHLQYGSSASGNYTITLHDLMCANGIDSHVLSLCTTFKPTDRKIEWLGRVPNLKSNIDFKIQNFLNRNNNSKFGGFSYPILGTDISQHKLVIQADVIYVHWVLNGFLNINSLIKVAKLGKPMVFVLHDMWTFTGGCHHSFDCDKFISVCSSCQILPKSKIFDRSSHLFRKKLKFFQSFTNFKFVAPSIWMKDKAESSKILEGKSINYIPNSVSPKFYQSKKSEARGKYGLVPGRKVIGFGANYVNSPYKGFELLLRALQCLGDTSDISSYQILVFGMLPNEGFFDFLPIDVFPTGYLKDEDSIRMAYCAMDVFVIPSVAESGPITAIESQKCGVPVVSFKVGGLPQMIDHKENGYLASGFDSKDLAKGIVYCLENNLGGYLKPDFESTSIFAKHLEMLNQMAV